MSLFGGYPLAPKPPFTPGYELVGRVEKLGPSVRGLKEDQVVVALNPAFGCQADHVCVAADLCVSIGESTDPTEAVSLVLNYLTAHCILHKKARLQKYEKVLIHSAAGGVGTALLQLGTELGLTMYGTASREKHGIVQDLGGIPIDYRSEDFAKVIQKNEPEGLDAAFDPIGGANLRKSYNVLRRGGRVVSYGFAGDKFGGMGQMAKGVLLVSLLNAWPDGKRVHLCATPSEVRKDNHWYRTTLSELVDRLENGKVAPIVGCDEFRFPRHQQHTVYLWKVVPVERVVLVH
ncbi:oxidoreductase [Tamilnaduibacter salinus]|uniref:Oxidoreductase n=1 Tax=Tamilnaduibacter salinus TaxID=1484056 RepID=A0A2A2HZ19_9GAMM|nr:zinc-binding dehydrogenase [Tamilnaduibacter salinus]PAV24462.1 oxidoreductase [Tamilnaduibacter salinus]